MSLNRRFSAAFMKNFSAAKSGLPRTIRRRLKRKLKCVKPAVFIIPPNTLSNILWRILLVKKLRGLHRLKLLILKLSIPLVGRAVSFWARILICLIITKTFIRRLPPRNEINTKLIFTFPNLVNLLLPLKNARTFCGTIFSAWTLTRKPPK